MTEHIDNFTKLLADLQNLGDEIKDEDKALILLNSLPESYDHLCTTIMYEKEKLVFADISSILINNEYRKKDKQVQQDVSSEALTVRERSQSRQFEKSKRRWSSCSKSQGGSSRNLARD